VPSAASLARFSRSCRTLAPLAVEAGSFGQICIRSRSIGFFAAYGEAVADIDRSRRIAADPQSVWDVLADFGSISSWADNIDHSCILNQGSEPIGTTRRVQIGRNALVETITEFDTTRALGYDVEGLPKHVRRFNNRWSLRPAADGGTVVTLTSTVEIGSGPMRKLAERGVCRVQVRQSDVMLAGLANRLEKLDA
jgi:Polyketide cyclase / dehydrase and lipid transport